MPLCLTLEPELLVERFGDEALVFVPRSDHWVRLNRTATELLLVLQERCEVHLAVDDLAHLVTERYGVGPADAQDAAAALLDGWTRAGIACYNADASQDNCQDVPI